MVKKTGIWLPDRQDIIWIDYNPRNYSAGLNIGRFKLIAKSRMGRAARNPSLKESIMMGFGYRLYPSALNQLTCYYRTMVKKTGACLPDRQDIIWIDYNPRNYSAGLKIGKFKLIAKSRMGRAARNPSIKESVMMGFGYRLR